MTETVPLYIFLFRKMEIIIHLPKYVSIKTTSSLNLFKLQKLTHSELTSLSNQPKFYLDVKMWKMSLNLI